MEDYGRVMRSGRRNRRILAGVAGAVFLWGMSDPAQAYIGPGAGFAVVGSFLVMFTAMVSAVVILFTWPLRYVIRMIRGRHAMAKSKVKRVVILGLDGLDYGLTETFLAEGKLPNLAKLKAQGSFGPLATTTPSMSPVAWSSFQTGVNPGKHNIFDFLGRDKKTYQPILSSVDIRGSRRSIRLGRYRIPVGKADIRLMRKSVPFWKVLGEHGIFSSIIRVPITFPPEKFRGVQLSAMCVPDLRGTQGMFSFYTTRSDSDTDRTGGQYYPVTRNNGAVKMELVGPDDPFRADRGALKLGFEVRIHDGNKAELRLDGQKIALKQDEYTSWVRVAFKTSLGMKVQGICQFRLVSIEPEFELYVTPINIDPEKPAMPISYPTIYSTYMAKQQGPFATLGLAEDSWGLNEKCLSDDAFLQQCIQIDDEREVMFFDSLEKVKRGCCVCVFDGTDRVQHAFWRQMDPRHPSHQSGYQTTEVNAVETLYQRADRLVGKAMAKCNDADTLFMVISDHGFNAFCYGVDLNRWLEENGYLTLKEGGRGEKHLSGVDWSKTRAYAVGLSGLYINVKGRESQGIVEPNEQAALQEEIGEKLNQLMDTTRNRPAIKTIYHAQKIYTGPYKGNAPDLLVGYHRDYRASWETAVGQVTDQVILDNTKAWSGDHCIDPTLVPGVLFCNRAVSTEKPRLMDIGPTVLDHFGVTAPGYMDGRPLTVGDMKKTEVGS